MKSLHRLGELCRDYAKCVRRQIQEEFGGNLEHHTVVNLYRPLDPVIKMP